MLPSFFLNLSQHNQTQSAFIKLVTILTENQHHHLLLGVAFSSLDRFALNPFLTCAALFLSPVVAMYYNGTHIMMDYRWLFYYFNTFLGNSEKKETSIDITVIFPLPTTTFGYEAVVRKVNIFLRRHVTFDSDVWKIRNNLCSFSAAAPTVLTNFNWKTMQNTRACVEELRVYIVQKVTGCAGDQHVHQ